jgi:hypothetical protein
MPEQYALNCAAAVRATPTPSTSKQSKTTLLSTRMRSLASVNSRQGENIGDPSDALVDPEPETRADHRKRDRERIERAYPRSSHEEPAAAVPIAWIISVAMD